MIGISQGDIVKISGFKNLFLVISNNAFIQSTGVFHVCPILDVKEGVLHIKINAHDTKGVAVCEQIKLIDPALRSCMPIDSISYENKMDISDAIQAIFEYD